jgi:two-component sensor histidine kinase
LRNETAVDLESADERTIRLLNEEVALLRRRAAHSNKSIRRVEALADAASARFAQSNALASKEIALLRKRVSHAHKRERGLKAVAKASDARSAERGAMLHEVNHRAKNSIQMAISLLNLQRQASEDPEVRLSLATAVERLGHIARVHSMLYGHTPDQQVIDFGHYLKTFCSELQEALAGDIEVVCQGWDEITLDSRRAVNLALITSEGVTNALKHAFPDGGAGTVTVSCSRNDAEHATLTIQDDGIGMRDGTGDQTMGLKLINTLVKGVNGALSIDGASGTRVEVTFPL